MTSALARSRRYWTWLGYVRWDGIAAFVAITVLAGAAGGYVEHLLH